MLVGVRSSMRKVKQMANEAGTMLTCGHDGCGCRVRIEVECHCAGSEQAYRCICGDEMVAVG
jgi:metallothionein